MIALNNALKLLAAHDYRDGNGTIPIVIMKCNREKKKGGQLIQIDKACSCGLPPTCKNANEMRGVMDMETGKKYAVHNRLIFQINGKEVYWV